MKSQSVRSNLLPHKAGGFDPDAFIREYENVYKKASNRSGYKTKKTFAPSKLGWDKGEGICPRYWFIAFSGAEFVEDVDSLAQARMDNGTGAHERIQATIEKMGVLNEKEKEIVSEDPPIRGFVDIMVDWDNTVIPGEIKTAGSDSFIFRMTSGKPSASHYVQFIIYLKVLRAKEGFLLYENKDTQELLIIKITVDEKVVADANYLFDWMQQVHGSWKAGKLPKKPWTRKNAAICKVCPVRGDCFDPEKFGEGVVELPVLEVPKP